MAEILIDARLYGLENTGLGRYTMNLISEISKLDTKNQYILLLRKKYFESLSISLKWKKVLADFRHYSVEEQINLPRLISSLQPDLVHFPHLNVPILYEGRFVVTIHDLIMQKQGKDATTLPLAFYYAKRIPFGMIARRAAVSSEAIIVPSNSVKQEVSKYYKISQDKIYVTYEGIDWELTPTKDQKKILYKYGIKNKYYIYIGNVYPHKNVERLIQSIKQINIGSNEKIDLVIVCARSVFLERIKNFALTNRAEEYVKLLGFVSDDELKVLYNNSIAFAYPSLSEGFGLQGLEAIKSGTLLLASDIPVFREVYKGGALYFDPLDPASIAKTMQQSLKMSKEKRGQIIKKNQNFIKKYSWRKMAEETLKVYEVALNQP